MVNTEYISIINTYPLHNLGARVPSTIRVALTSLLERRADAVSLLCSAGVEERRVGGEGGVAGVN